jgi:hypothetical protein
MTFTNHLPVVDTEQKVTLKLLEQIQNRVCEGYRLKADFNILLEFAKQQLETTNA